MKTTNLKQTSVAKPRKWFQRRRRWHDPREARAERIMHFALKLGVTRNLSDED